MYIYKIYYIYFNTMHNMLYNTVPNCGFLLNPDIY